MPALDQCHDQVVRALEKAGWVVSKAPYTLAPNPDRTLFADMELRCASETGEQVIIIVRSELLS